MREREKLKNVSLLVFVKGKVTEFYLFFISYVQVDFYSQLERESGIGGENQRWQIESLATCVLRLLQVDQAFLITGKLTVESRSTNVLSATNHLSKLVI